MEQTCDRRHKRSKYCGAIATRKIMEPSQGMIVPHNSRVIVARQQGHQRRRSLGHVKGHFSCTSIAARHRGFSPRPPLSVAIGWPQRDRAASHVTKMLNEFERMELDVIDGARACVPRGQCIAWPRPGELQYRRNRCLCVRVTTMVANDAL